MAPQPSLLALFPIRRTCLLKSTENFKPVPFENNQCCFNYSKKNCYHLGTQNIKQAMEK